MVAVEVAVRDQPDILVPNAMLGEHRADRAHVHGREGRGRRAILGRKARVEEEQASRMLYEERAHDDPVVRELRSGRRHRVVAGVQRPDPSQRRVGHGPILTQSLVPQA
jgi:hypothetical protein